MSYTRLLYQVKIKTELLAILAVFSLIVLIVAGISFFTYNSLDNVII